MKINKPKTLFNNPKENLSKKIYEPKPPLPVKVKNSILKIKP